MSARIQSMRSREELIREVLQYKDVPVDLAAEVLVASPQFVRIAPRKPAIPIGVAVQTSRNRYVYHISPIKLLEYQGWIVISADGGVKIAPIIQPAIQSVTIPRPQSNTLQAPIPTPHNPCNGCTERYVGCHAQCHAYAEWSKARGMIKRREAAKKKGYNSASEYIRERRKRG